MRAQLIITCLTVILSQAGCDSQPLPTAQTTPTAEDGAQEVARELEEIVEIAVFDDQDEITNGPWDNLFELTLLSSPRSFHKDEIAVFAAYGSFAPLKFRLNDLNGNALLDPGESLSCIEPAVDTFGTWIVGEEVSIGLKEIREGVVKSISAGTWIADN